MTNRLKHWLVSGRGIIIRLGVWGAASWDEISHTNTILDWDFTDSGKLRFLPQVLQKNMGLFSFRSQLAQEG